MPAKYRATAILPVAAEEYFMTKDSPAFTSLLAQIQKLQSITFVQLLPSDDPDVDVMDIETIPDLSAYVPKQLLRFITFDPAVHDYVTYQREKVAGPTYQWTTTSSLPSLGQNFKNVYTITVTPLTESTCEMVAEGEVTIKLRMISGTAERITSESIGTGISNMSMVMERWIEVRNKLMESDEGRAAILQGRPPLNVIPAGALEALARPYNTTDDSIDVGHEFEGDVFFDPEELEVLEIPDNASPAVVNMLTEDAIELLHLAEQAGDAELMPEILGQGEPLQKMGSRTQERIKNTSAKVKASLQKAQTDWNVQFSEWSKFWENNAHHIASPTISPVGARMKNMVKVADGLGLVSFKGQVDDPDEQKRISRSKTWVKARLNSLSEQHNKHTSQLKRVVTKAGGAASSSLKTAVTIVKRNNSRNDENSKQRSMNTFDEDSREDSPVGPIGKITGGVTAGIAAVSHGIGACVSTVAGGVNAAGKGVVGGVDVATSGIAKLFTSSDNNDKQ